MQFAGRSLCKSVCWRYLLLSTFWNSYLLCFPWFWGPNKTASLVWLQLFWFGTRYNCKLWFLFARTCRNEVIYVLIEMIFKKSSESLSLEIDPMKNFIWQYIRICFRNFSHIEHVFSRICTKWWFEVRSQHPSENTVGGLGPSGYPYPFE